MAMYVTESATAAVSVLELKSDPHSEANPSPS